MRYNRSSFNDRNENVKFKTINLLPSFLKIKLEDQSYKIQPIDLISGYVPSEKRSVEALGDTLMEGAGLGFFINQPNLEQRYDIKSTADAYLVWDKIKKTLYGTHFYANFVDCQYLRKNIEIKPKNNKLPFTFSNDYEYEDVLSIGEIADVVTPVVRRLIGDFKQPTSFVLDGDNAYGTYTQISCNHGLVARYLIDGTKNAYIPAFISHYPYADNTGESAIVFAQEKAEYVPPGPGEEDGHFEYTPNQATPRCLVGSTLFNEGINVLRSITGITDGWVGNDDLQSVFVVSGKGTSKYGGNDNKPFINMAADVNILPSTPGPGNLEWDTSFNINTQCCVKLPQSKSFKIMPYVEYNYNQFLVGNIPNDADDLLAVSYNEENGFWDFICKIGTYLKKGLQVAIDIGTKVSPIIKAIAEVVGNETRPVLLIEGDMKLSASSDFIPKIDLTAGECKHKILTTPGTKWSISPYTIANGLINEGEDLIQINYSTANVNIWEIFNKVMAWFEKGLKVVNKIEGAYHSILEVINEGNAMPAINMAGNLRVARSTVVNNEEVPTVTIIDGNAHYTYNALATDDTEIANHAYVLAHSGGGEGVLHKAGTETITGVKTFNVLPVSSIVPSSSNQFVNKSYVDSKVIDRESDEDQIISGLGKWIFKLVPALFSRSDSVQTYLAKVTWEGIKWFFEQDGQEVRNRYSSIMRDGHALRISSVFDDNSNEIILNPEYNSIQISTNPTIVNVSGDLSDNTLVTKSYVDSQHEEYLKLNCDHIQELNTSGIEVKTGSWTFYPGSEILFPHDIPTHITSFGYQDLEYDVFTIQSLYVHTEHEPPQPSMSKIHVDGKGARLTLIVDDATTGCVSFMEMAQDHIVFNRRPEVPFESGETDYIVTRSELNNYVTKDELGTYLELDSPNIQNVKSNVVFEGECPSFDGLYTPNDRHLTTKEYVDNGLVTITEMCIQKNTGVNQRITCPSLAFGDTVLFFVGENHDPDVSNHNNYIRRYCDTTGIEDQIQMASECTFNNGSINAAVIHLCARRDAVYINNTTNHIGIVENRIEMSTNPIIVNTKNVNDIDDNSLITKSYVDQNTIRPVISSGVDEYNKEYEQAEISFDFFKTGKPFSFIMRRSKSGKTYKDKLMVKEIDGNLSTIVEGQWLKV